LKSARASIPGESSIRAPREIFSSVARARRQPRATWGVVALLSVGLSGGAGCSGQSSFLTVGPTAGQLKTSLSHLEYENQQLKKNTAKLERENRSLEDRLVQEQIENGDLAARLDDARNVLRDRGIDADLRLGSHHGGETLGADARDREGAEPANSPDGSRPRRRRTPFAQISSAGDSAAPVEVQEPKDLDQSQRRRARRMPRPADDDSSDQHSYHKPPQDWLPVADNSDDSMIRIR
jgi:hypothetical protein